MAESTRAVGAEEAAGLGPATRAAVRVGTGAAAGAVLGRLLGGGRAGVALGAAAGAVAGVAVALVETGARTDTRGLSARPEAARREPRPEASRPEAAQEAPRSRRPGAGPSEPDRRDGGDAAAKRARRREYESRTKAELYDRARELDIPGRSRMRKAELIDALLERDASPPG